MQARGRLGRNQRGSFQATGGSRTRLRGILCRDEAGAATVCRFRGGESGVGWGGVEAAPAALWRAPWEVGLLPPGPGMMDGWEQTPSKEAPQPLEAQIPGTGGVPSAKKKKRAFPLCKGVSSPHLTHFPRSQGRQCGSGSGWGGGSVYFRKPSCQPCTPLLLGQGACLPFTWYRARCVWQQEQRGGQVRAPGARPVAHTERPCVVAGSSQGRWVVSVSLLGGFQTNKQKVLFFFSPKKSGTNPDI